MKEFNRLSSQTSRPNVKKVLEFEIQRIESVLNAIQKNKAVSSSNTECPNSNLKVIKKITSFAFDESDKFAKIYLSVSNAHKITLNAVKSFFTENSVAISVEVENNVIAEFNAVGFSFPIDISKSYVKIKTDSLLVMLKKIKEGQQWGKLLKLDKKADIELPKMDGTSDPQDGLMSMMKKMYDDGDDEMKRTIKKAFYESRNKADGPNPMDF